MLNRYFWLRTSYKVTVKTSLGAASSEGLIEVKGFGSKTDSSCGQQVSAGFWVEVFIMGDALMFCISMAGLLRVNKPREIRWGEFNVFII